MKVQDSVLVLDNQNYLNIHFDILATNFQLLNIFMPMTNLRLPPIIF